MPWAPLPLDTNPDAVSVGILSRLKNRIAGWLPSEGDPVTVFAEEIGRESALTNLRTLDAFDRAVADFGTSVHKVAAIEAQTATISVRLTVTASGAVVPAGFRVAGTTTAGVEVAFVLANSVTSTSTTADVTMTAQTTGAAANDVPVGALKVITATATVVSAAALAKSSGGVDAETLNAYLDRLTAQLAILTPGGVRAEDLAVLARSVAGVHRALGIDLLNPGRKVTDGATTLNSTTVTSATAAFTTDPMIGSDVGRTIAGAGVPAGATITAVNSATSVTISAAATATATGVTLTFGDLTSQPKTVTVVPVNADGQPVDATTRAAVKALMESVREVNFVIRIGEPTYTPVSIYFEVVPEFGADPAATQAAVHAAGVEFLNPGRFAAGDDLSQPTWVFRNTIRYLELSRVLGSADGAAFVSALTINGGTSDVILPGYAPLPAPTSGVASPSTVTGIAV